MKEIFVPDWLKRTFEQTQRELAATHPDNLPHWLRQARAASEPPR